MAVDQIELLTQEKSRELESHPSDVQSVLESLPVTPVRHFEVQSAESVLDSMVKETEETLATEEGPVLRTFLTSLNAITFVLAVGSVLFLTWAAGQSILKYLAHK